MQWHADGPKRHEYGLETFEKRSWFEHDNKSSFFSHCLNLYGRLLLLKLNGSLLLRLLSHSHLRSLTQRDNLAVRPSNDAWRKKLFFEIRRWTVSVEMQRRKLLFFEMRRWTVSDSEVDRSL